MEEQNADQTYAYEVDQDSEKLLKIKKQEIKYLREKAAKDKRHKLANSAQMRAIRDDKLDRITLKLKTIKEKMVYYNRAGKVEKDGIDIFANILDYINSDVELAEEIQRGKVEVSQEVMKAEAVEESEVSLD